MPLIDALLAQQTQGLGRRKTTKKSYFQPLYGEQPRTASPTPAQPTSSLSALSAPPAGPSILTPPAPSGPTPQNIDLGLPKLGDQPTYGLGEALVDSSVAGKARPPVKQPKIGIPTDTSLNVPITGDNAYLNEVNDMGGIRGESNITTPNINYGTDSPAQVTNPGQEGENRRILQDDKSIEDALRSQGLLPEGNGINPITGKVAGPDIVDLENLPDLGFQPTYKKPGDDLASAILSSFSDALNPSLARTGFGKRRLKLPATGPGGEKFFVDSETGERIPEGG